MKLKFSLFLAIICFGTICKSAGVRHHKSLAYYSGNTAHADIASLLCPDDLLAFAQSLIGTRYRVASSNPLHGFDCSGFVSYVFKNFNIAVPRSSYDFASVGERIALEDARPGDVILFTGTHTRNRRIGHIGIIWSNQDNGISFIHSTSGKEHGVTITAMDKNYRHRFVRVIRLLKQNDEV